MAKSLSPENRKALKNAPNPNKGGGGGSELFFNTSDMTKAVIRLTPCNPGTDIKLVGEAWVDGKPFIAPGVTHNKPCLFAEVVRRLSSAQSEKAKKIAQAIKPKNRYWVKAVVRDEDGGGEVKIVKLPKDCYKVIYEVIDTDDTDISDADEGMDVRISSNGKPGLDREYSARVLGESPLSTDKKKAKAWVAAAAAIDFDQYLKYDAAAQLAALKKAVGGLLNVDKIAAEIGFLEDADESDESDDSDEEGDDAEDAENDDEEDDAPNKKPVAKKKPAAKNEDDEEEDGSDDEEDDSDDEEDDSDDEEDDDESEDEKPAAKPKGKAAAKKPAKDEDEDDEDEDEDADDEEDDEEEEEPVAKKGAAKKPAPKASKKAPIDEDEDDEEDDEDDEEEEPAPKKKSAGAASVKAAIKKTGKK